MTTDVVEAEATGQPFFVAEYGGAEYKLPTDADLWPLREIRSGQILAALPALLGGQWYSFLTVSPKRRHLVPASNAFAAAAGFPILEPKHDTVFGSLPRVLELIARWPATVESDLNRLWDLDYRDRFRFDNDGNRRLTLRQIGVRVTNLPMDASLAAKLHGGKAPLTRTDLLLMDLHRDFTGVVHPERPLSPEQVEKVVAEQKVMDDERRKYRERTQKRQAATALKDTARANALRAQGKASNDR